MAHTTFLYLSRHNKYKHRRKEYNNTLPQDKFSCVTEKIIKLILKTYLKTVSVTYRKLSPLPLLYFLNTSLFMTH